ncbi:MAG: hypothetical protein K940chlam7_01585 [Chlamydiae bacterium]|nr:hypothetical protein [Chlamydiota bacterium]
MELKEHYTNEELCSKFDNQFNLVNYAIGLVGEMIRTGREPRVKSETENPALLVLEEILAGKDKLEERPVEEKTPLKSSAEVSTTEVVKESVIEEVEEGDKVLSE